MKRCPHCPAKFDTPAELEAHLLTDERYPLEDAEIVAYSDRY